MAEGTGRAGEPRGHGFAGYVGPIDLTGDVFSFTVEPRHLNGGDRLHGGMMMSFASLVLGAVADRAAEGGQASPLSINCDFVSAGEPGDRVEASGEITRKTRTVLFVAATLKARGKVMMTATGVYKVVAEARA
ncbi:MAG: PaaI family thioesterase [Parvibaculaceae bacterium]|nr:PaaI family thioesterase [Parvibaculaceae bacterium]